MFVKLSYRIQVNCLDLFDSSFPHQQYTRLPFPPHAHHHLLLLIFSIMAIQQGWAAISVWLWFAFPWWIVVFEPLFMCLWPRVCFLWKVFYSDSLLFLNRIFVVVVTELYEFFISHVNPLLGVICKYFLLFVVFLLLIISHACRSFLVWESPTCLFLLSLFCFAVKWKQSLLRPISRSKGVGEHACSTCPLRSLEKVTVSP